MPALASGPSPRRLAPALAGALAALALVAGLATACGISYGDDDKSTELFQSLTVDGEFVTGGRISIELTYGQVYPVDVTIACALTARAGQDVPAETPTPAPTPDPADEPTPIDIPGPAPVPDHIVLEIAESLARAHPDGVPPDEATPVPGTLTAAFIAPEQPGPYAVRCYTPADINNFIKRNISIAAR